jgi:CO/xanthine dehydrogenase Mo-binding subunit
MIAEPAVTRRSFLKLVGGVGAGFALGSFSLVSACSPKKADAAEVSARAFVPNGYVKIDPNGMITVTIYRSDMGQGVRTSLAMLVAEELDADWHKIQVVQAPGGSVPVPGQGTGGSASIRSSYHHMRQIGAAARVMLVAAAARTWGVDPSVCTTSEGKVLGPSGKSISYADLTTAASGIPIPDEKAVKLKDASDFKIIGKATARIDNPNVVTGKAMYGIDVKVDGMKYAVLLRPPSIGAKMQSMDDSEARKVLGVMDVLHTGAGVAVIATNTWAAIKGRDALKTTWDQSANANLDSSGIRAQLVSALLSDKPTVPDGAKVVEATLDFPFLAHSTMEPLNAVADVKDGSCTVWAGTQTPDGAQHQVAQQLGIPASSVTINVMLLGGGFGRRLFNEYITEAVEISKAAKCPIKLLWTREDDMRNDHYRSMSHHAFIGAVDAGGNPVAWQHQAVQAEGQGDLRRERDAGIPYKIDGATMYRGGPGTSVSTGPWRSVENTQLAVANECFIDEMAHAAGKDPFEFRRDLIEDKRLKTVLETAAEKFGWGTPLPAGTSRGIACFSGYGSAAAHVVELTVKGDEIKLNRIVAVVDVGVAVNPKGVEAQLQGACSDGLSTALRAAITVEKGAIVQGSWDSYNWITLDAVPPVEVVVLQSGGSPGGMGEPGYPSVAPAVANAVFAATGKRVRRFPIKISELV